MSIRIRVRASISNGAPTFLTTAAKMRTFLLSNALYWLKNSHRRPAREAVASMLYLDYARTEWVPNHIGGRENLEAIDFLKRFNELLHKEPGAISIAEESTAWPRVSKPVYLNGLGFTMKWNMGWMHDMFHYFLKIRCTVRITHQN